MRKNRIIGFAVAAVAAFGLTAGVATTAGAFSGGEDGSGGAKPAKQSGRTTHGSKADAEHGAKPEGVAVQRTEDGLKVRKLTRKEWENTHGAKPTKPRSEGKAAEEGKPAK
ncbi:hypothetical protein [Streptomyces sp. NPDC005438]|uniref:hypothetical protein n=1 Tax=Streptomyces sp. NPDC005438 TaxID=3156880 RepID=UPI0033A483AA